MARTITEMNGNANSAKRVSTQSRDTMTAVRAMIVPTCRSAMTSTVEDSRARRFTSMMTRDVSSALWTSLKNASGIRWMCR